MSANSPEASNTSLSLYAKRERERENAAIYHYIIFVIAVDNYREMCVTR